MLRVVAPLDCGSVAICNPPPGGNRTADSERSQPPAAKLSVFQAEPRFMSASGWPSGNRMVSPRIAVRGPFETCLGPMEREHGDIPLRELAGLADTIRSEGLEDREEIVRAMQDQFGLARLASTRQRFELAADL